MAKPRILIFSGYGLNCEEETKFAFEAAGGQADIVHVNDLIADPKRLNRYQIVAFPGGFSYGDDTGSGKAYANKVRNNLYPELQEFLARDTLAVGICNGFQIVTNLGLLPGALTYNDGGRYLDRWVDVRVEGKSPWLTGIERLSLPIAHGEGKFYADTKTLAALNKSGAIALRYEKGEICRYENLSANPNGALEDIAGVLSHEGRVLGLMPHPERALSVTNLPHFPYLKEKAAREGKRLATRGPGFQIFRNAIEYF